MPKRGFDDTESAISQHRGTFLVRLDADEISPRQRHLYDLGKLAHVRATVDNSVKALRAKMGVEFAVPLQNAGGTFQRSRHWFEGN